MNIKERRLHYLNCIQFFMDLFILRPIITTIVEYSLFAYVLKKGKFYPKIIAGILFFLATYQLGEVIFLATGENFGIQISYASTSMLPAIGLLLIQKITKRRYGYSIIQGIAAAFSVFFLLKPDFINGVESMHCFTKLIANINDGGPIFWAWITYYIGTLTVSCFILFNKFYKAQTKKMKNIYGLGLLSYLSFFPVAIIMILLFGIDIAYLASIMCGLAIFAAFILSWMSLRFK